MRTTYLICATLFLFTFSCQKKNNSDNKEVTSEKELFWSDEFNGEALDESKWVYEIGDGCPNLCGWGNNELQYYRKENLKIKDGKLIITAIKDNNETHEYTSSRIKTEGKLSFKYGQIDVKAKLPKGKGIWPAIWMLGSSIQIDGWPICGELDIMELRGSSPNTVCGTIHFQNTNNTHEYAEPKCYSIDNEDFSSDFHVFSANWNKKGITWLVDEIPFMSISYDEIDTDQNNIAFQKEFYVILNLAIGGNYDGNPTDGTIFPQAMEVDYVRIYKN